MGVRLNPYLNFVDGQAREAMEHYRSVLGGELNLMTFGEMGAEGDAAPLVMHAQLETPDGFTLMGADTPTEFMEVTVGDNYGVSLSGDDPEKFRSWYDALSEGGRVTMPLGKQMWGDHFGSFVDRFGIPWLVNIAGSAVPE